MRWLHTIPPLDDLVGMIVILILSLVLRISGIASATGRSIDLDREMFVTGNINIAIGLVRAHHSAVTVPSQYRSSTTTVPGVPVPGTTVPGVPIPGTTVPGVPVPGMTSSMTVRGVARPFHDRFTGRGAARSDLTRPVSSA